MSWILADIKSILPLAQTAVSSVPKPGDVAPSFKADSRKDGEAASNLEYPLASKKPSVLVFVRHLGCPFCQETIQERLIPLARKRQDVDFFLVSQADIETTRNYVSRLPVQDPSNIPFTILSSPAPHSLYSIWGISQLSLSSVFSPGVIGRVMDLAKDKGIKNQETVGSRWLNSGAFAVDKDGKVLWSHVAARADDVSDLEVAVGAIDAQK